MEGISRSSSFQQKYDLSKELTEFYFVLSNLVTFRPALELTAVNLFAVEWSTALPARRHKWPPFGVTTPTVTHPSSLSKTHFKEFQLSIQMSVTG